MGKIKPPNLMQLTLISVAVLSIWFGMNQLPVPDSVGWYIFSSAVIFYSGFVLGRALENWQLMSDKEYPLKSGIYSEHSHPIYLGTFLLFSGVSLLLKSSYGIIFSTLMGIWLIRQSIKEGREINRVKNIDRSKGKEIHDKGET